MDLLVLSDLHFEHMFDFGKTFLSQQWPKHDVVVLAGDISSYSHIEYALAECSKVFKKIVYVAGNHEFYGRSIAETRRLLSTINLPNVYILDNSTCVIDGQRFIGTTMWYPQDKSYHLRSEMGDFRYIEAADPTIFKENEAAVRFLTANIGAKDVVVTHFLPSTQSIAEKYQGDETNDYFLCNMEPLIALWSPPLWIHGHTHESMDYTQCGTRVYCNPYGYFDIQDLNPNFKVSIVSI